MALIRALSGSSGGGSSKEYIESIAPSDATIMGGSGQNTISITKSCYINAIMELAYSSSGYLKVYKNGTQIAGISQADSPSGTFLNICQSAKSGDTFLFDLNTNYSNNVCWLIDA